VYERSVKDSSGVGGEKLPAHQSLPGLVVINRRNAERNEKGYMAIKQFLVENYQVRFADALNATFGDTTIRARGIVACFGGDHRFIAYFLTDDSPAPNPFYVEANKVGAIFLSFREIGPFVDLLRNEEPIYAYLNSDTPSWNSIRTAEEPVGEEEG
jgi:hypothetical protein